MTIVLIFFIAYVIFKIYNGFFAIKNRKILIKTEKPKSKKTEPKPNDSKSKKTETEKPKKPKPKETLSLTNRTLPFILEF